MLRALRSATSAVTIESMADSLCLSIALLHEHIQALRDIGYVIEGGPSGGYVLAGVPSWLTPHQIVMELEGYGPDPSSASSATPSLPSFPVQLHSSLPSTNDHAKSLASRGAPSGTTVVSETQSAGRGRLGRSWSSPRGGCWFSVIVRPEVSLGSSGLLTLGAANVVANSIRKMLSELSMGFGAPRQVSAHATVPDPAEVTLKWPNDVLLGQGKLGGILCEATGQEGRLEWLVVGVGLNIGYISDEGLDRVARESGRDVAFITLPEGSAGSIAAALIADIVKGIVAAAVSASTADTISEWRALSATLGRRVSISVPWPKGALIEGVAVDLAEDGAIVVRQDDGTLTHVAVGDLLYHPE